MLELRLLEQLHINFSKNLIDDQCIPELFTSLQACKDLTILDIFMNQNPLECLFVQGSDQSLNQTMK